MSGGDSFELSSLKWRIYFKGKQFPSDGPPFHRAGPGEKILQEKDRNRRPHSFNLGSSFGWRARKDNQ